MRGGWVGGGDGRKMWVCVCVWGAALENPSTLSLTGSPWFVGRVGLI